MLHSWSFLFVLTLLIIPGSDARSPGDGSLAVALDDCPKCQDDFWIGQSHKFASQGANYSCEPNSCHGSWQNGECSDYHFDCDVTLLLESGGAQLVEQLVAAEEWGELGVLIDRESALALNIERQAVQILGCDGSVVGQFALPDKGVAALNQ